MISGKTTLIAHLGYPTESFKAPLIYNPWFDSKGIDAVVMPMGVKAEDYPAFFERLCKLSNIRGALVTMPHKVTTVDLLDEASTAVKVAGACNAVLRPRRWQDRRRHVRRPGIHAGPEAQELRRQGQVLPRPRHRRRRLGHCRVARGGRHRAHGGVATPTRRAPRGSPVV